MKPSKLRRAMKHAGKSEQEYRVELARRAFNEGFGTTRETALILASSDCGGEDVSILLRVREGQGGMIADVGMSAPVSHGMTRTPDSGKVNRSLAVKAENQHFRDIVGDRDRLVAHALRGNFDVKPEKYGPKPCGAFVKGSYVPAPAI